MNEEKKIKVYIKINTGNEVTAINSEIFIKDLSGWIFVDEGYGDKYAHAQNNYLDDPIIDRTGQYNYVYINNKIQRR